MDHQSELEKSKYRHWVRGGLAFKYLKDGIEEFTDDIVLREHKRILQAINHTPALTCNQCNIRSLKPLHKSAKDPNTGKSRCRWGQTNCNCMHSNKQQCPNNVCDTIMEEVLKCHASTPPAQNWRNTDHHNWCSNPWEIAKCFIKAPGYSDKSAASDIDAPGLLHLFINNTRLHSYISCAITGTDVFSKTLKRRNEIFHSPKMELEEPNLKEYIDDIVAILEDDKELKERPEAKQAVEKLEQLKQDNFIITTYNEAEVCRAAMTSITISSEELKQVIQNAKTDIKLKEEEISKRFDDKTQNVLDKALGTLEKQSENILEAMKQTIELLKERVRQLEVDNSDIKQRLTVIETDRKMLKDAHDICQKQLGYIEQKQVLQRKLVERYQKYYVKTWISPLKCQEDDINIEQVYFTPDIVVEEKTLPKTEKETTKFNAKTESGPEATSSTNSECVTVLKTLVGNTGTETKDNKRAMSHMKPVNKYSDIFQTNGLRNKKIYIVGDAGTGKSSFIKMMINNWCKSTGGDNSGTRIQMSTNDNDNSQTQSNTGNLTIDNSEEVENLKEMQKFQFLFFVPLQRMSRFSSDLLEMVQELYKDIMTDELIKRIFDQESDHCCIIADGLDEWIIPKKFPRPMHISYGIPNGDKVQNATTVTLSRPSARGILNLKSSECDIKIKLRGVSEESLPELTRKYMTIQSQSGFSTSDFPEKIKEKFSYLEKTPMLLQQLVWLYCTEKDIGSSISEIYGSILNILLGWSQTKEEDEDLTDDPTRVPKEFEQMQFPESLKRFSRCETNQRFIFILSKLAFESLTNDIPSCTLARSKLLKCGLSKADIASLIKYGIIEEYNSFDPTFEFTCLSFIHLSYLEFFAAVYVSICYETLQCSTMTKKRKMERKPLEDIFLKITSIADILQMSNVLVMICGLSPFLFGEISCFISKLARNDTNLIKHRENLIESDIAEPKLIQQLLQDCFVEGKMDHQIAISLSDIILTDDVDEQFIRRINPKEVLSLCIENYSFWIDNWAFEWIAQLPHLQFACIEIDNVECDRFNQLLNSFEKNFSLKQLMLYDSYIRDIITYSSYTGCEIEAICFDHRIDLSKHDMLERIHFEYVMCIELSGLPPKNLERFYISGSSEFRENHYELKELSSYLEKAVSLKYLTIEDTQCESCRECHTIDLSDHSQLQVIDLECFSCKLGSAVDSRNLEVFYMRNISYDMKHEVCEQLASSLTQATALKELILQNVTCDCLECTYHQIDLSKHDALQTAHLINCSFTAVNSKIVVNTGQNSL